MGDIIPDDAIKKLNTQMDENNRINLEEIEKRQRIAQQKAEYEFNKAFEEWYKASEACQNPDSLKTLTLCANYRKKAKEGFTEAWNSKKNN